MKDFLDTTTSSMRFNDFVCMLDFQMRSAVNNLRNGRVKLDKKKNTSLPWLLMLWCVKSDS